MPQAMHPTHGSARGFALVVAGPLPICQLSKQQPPRAGILGKSVMKIRWFTFAAKAKSFSPRYATQHPANPAMGFSALMLESRVGR